MSSLPITLTRQSLHDQVWELPMSRLAPSYGITPQELSRLCKAHDVATPGSRFWTLKSMGRTVEKAKLAASARSPDEAITIVPRTRQPQRPPVAKVVAAEPQPISELKKPSKIELSPVSEPGNSEAAEDGSMHLSAAKIHAKLATRAPDGAAVVVVRDKGPSRVVASPASATRVAALLNRLFRAVENRGWIIKPAEGVLAFAIDGEPLACELVEQTDRVAHVKTPAELAALQRFEDEKAKAARRGTWFSEWSRPTLPVWDYIPNGKLTLRFETAYRHHGLRHSFSDGRRQRLGSQTDAILQSFAAYAAGEKEWRDEQERSRLQAVEDAKIRQEAQRRQTLEAKRLEFLTLQVERHAQAKRVEDFLATFGNVPHAEPSFSAFLTWAKGYAESVRAALTPEALGRKLERSGLMNDTTDFPSWRSVE